MMSRWNDVLIYAPQTDRSSLLDKLRNVVDSLDMINSVEVCRTVGELKKRLRQPRGRPGIIVLMPFSPKDLLDLLSMASLLDGPRIVVVLPDREADTITNGYALRPRFLTYSDTSFSDIGAVLKKMCNGSRV